jgi:CBS domain-containing protein/hemerythrin-like domain-containing protein
MDPTAVLRTEHTLVERVLGALDVLAERLEAGREPSAPVLEGALDFIGVFVDACHHAKEELLFDVLDAPESAIPAALVADLRAQHAETRRRLEEIQRLVLARDATLPARLREYAQRLRFHFQREDADLFPGVDATLGPQEAARLADAWDDLETRVAGPAARAALLELAETIATTTEPGAGAAPAAAPTVRDVMRSDVPSVAPRDSLGRAADMMGRLDIRELAVVEDGRVVGIVTRRDMEPYRGHLEWTTVETAMTRDPVTVRPETDVASVAKLLLARAFNAVPVTAGGTFLGMLGRADLLRILIAP